MQPPFRLVVRLKRPATWAHRLAPSVVSLSLVSLMCTAIPMSGEKTELTLPPRSPIPACTYFVPGTSAPLAAMTLNACT